MLTYQVHKSKRQRRLSLSVNQKGEIVVKAPFLIPNFIISKFVTQNELWLKQQIAKQKKIKVNQTAILIFGQKYQVEFIYDQALSLGWQIKDDFILYNSSLYQKQKKLLSQLNSNEEKKLDLFLQQTLRRYISLRLPYWQKKMNLIGQVKKFRIKKVSSHWGSCSSLSNLNFNEKLIHFPPAVIDYVLIHELAHLIHPNHSAQFWALVAKYDGQYQKHRTKLKSHPQL